MRSLNYQISNLLKISLILATFLLLVLIPVNIFAFNEGFYYDEFGKYGIYDKFDENEVNIEFEFKKVLDYIDDGKEIDGDFFNEKEKKHLEDVRKLFNVSKILIVVGLIIVGFSLGFLRKKEFLKSLYIGAVITIIFVLILFLISLFNFNNAFFNFHRIFFSNDLWLLDPNEDNLINLLPQEIFFDIVKRILLFSFVSSLIIIFIRKMF